MRKTTLCATILLFCCTIGHSLVHAQCGAQSLWTNCGLSFLSTPLTKIFNTTPGTKIPFSAAHNRPVTIVNQPPGQPARIMISDWLMRKAEVWYSDFLTASSLLVLLILDWLLMKRTNIWYSDFVTTSSLLVRLSDGTSLTGNFPKQGQV